METPTTSFNNFAEKYDEAMGDNGDRLHYGTIDPALFDALGDVKDKVIYDIACGNGYIDRRLIREEAKEVWASDISKNLVKIAQTKYDRSSIKYFIQDGGDFTNIPKEYFDLVFINMALHYIKDIPDFAQNIKNILKPGGSFVATIVHPLEGLTWYDLNQTSEEINRALKSAKSYITPIEVVDENPWTGEKNLKIYRRSIGFYLEIFSKSGFKIERFIEPATKKETILTNIPFVYAIREKKLA